MKTTAKVNKVSKSGKTMLVQFSANKYDIGFQFAWCANPDGLKKGSDVEDFNPKGREPIVKEGVALTHEDGSPVMRWVF